MVDFTRLANNWVAWSNMSQLSNPSASTDCGGAQVCFKSSDGSFYLRNERDRWILDEVDDRGQRHSGTASFSNFSLIEKYLIWNWASVARSAVGAQTLGSELYALGFSPEIQVSQVREGIYRLTSPFGDAVVMGVPATIFSHLMSKTVNEIEQIVSEGLA